MEAVKTDKFYTFLCSVLGALASVLDIALADDVAKVTMDNVAMVILQSVCSIQKRYARICQC